MLKVINLNKILVANFLLLFGLSTYIGRLYFLPSWNFLLVDFYNSIDYPNFWDTNLPFYSILPFNTLICIIFKNLYSINKLFPLLIIVIMISMTLIYIYNNLKFNSKLARYFYTILFLFLSPVSLAIFTGNIAIFKFLLLFLLLFQ